ncbi:MAG: hypothetical protein ACKOWC_00290 [Limnohabitans sp.]
MSTYLLSTKSLERWYVNWIEWDGDVLRASARLEGWTPSATDGQRFHLSIFSAREMDAQLAIIGLHLKLGLQRKTAEVWLLKSTEECLAPITNPDDVRFEMRFRMHRSGRRRIVTERLGDIRDDRGGHFHLDTRGLMPWNEAWGEAPIDA